MNTFPLFSFAKNDSFTDIVLLRIDIIITRLFSISNFVIWIFLLGYNINYINKNPESKPHNFVISLHLFFICTLYNVTFILPLTTTSTSYTSKLYFSTEFGSSLNNFLCPLQGIILTGCLLGMLSISLCIAITCYLNLFKTGVSKKVEVTMTSGSLIFSFILTLCCLIGNNPGEVMLVEANLLCWPHNMIWRLIYDIFFCGIYIANFVFIVIIIVKLLKTNMEEAKEYIVKMILLGIMLVTLVIYFADLIHSFYKNSKLLYKKNSGEQHQNQNDQPEENSNITSMVFCLFRDFFGMCTGVSLMLVYKPKYPKILCFKEKPDIVSILHIDDTTNELIEVN